MSRALRDVQSHAAREQIQAYHRRLKGKTPGLFSSLINRRRHAAGRGSYRVQSDINHIERVSCEGNCLQLPYKCLIIEKPWQNPGPPDRGGRHGYQNGRATR